MKQSLLIVFALCTAGLNAQGIFKGIGIFGSVTSNKHEYRNKDAKGKDTTFDFYDYYPQNHVSKELISWGAGLFVELGKEKVRWQTELEYINKGAKESPIQEPKDPLIFSTGHRTGQYFPNKLTYIQWNNYLKFFYPVFNAANWYWMAGVRAEYLFRSSAQVFPEYVATFPKFWFSGDLGLGYEFPLIGRVNAFLEGHWNPDIISHKHFRNTNIRARTFELRLGLVLRPKKRRIDDCNAPRYKGPAY